MELNGDRNGNAFARRNPGINARLTESVLRQQEGVLDASVWFHEGEMAAHVTVRDDAHWSVRDLQAVCLEELGLHQTPRTVLLIQARPTHAVMAA